MLLFFFFGHYKRFQKNRLKESLCVKENLKNYNLLINDVNNNDSTNKSQKDPILNVKTNLHFYRNKELK
jgi:hypothetical protein